VIQIGASNLELVIYNLELLIQSWSLSFSFDTHDSNLEVVLVDTHLIHSLHIHLEFLI
jgi:hypothetical protein